MSNDAPDKPKESTSAVVRRVLDDSKRGHPTATAIVTQDAFGLGGGWIKVAANLGAVVVVFVAFFFLLHGYVSDLSRQIEQARQESKENRDAFHEEAKAVRDEIRGEVKELAAGTYKLLSAHKEALGTLNVTLGKLEVEIRFIVDPRRPGPEREAPKSKGPRGG